MFTDLNPNMSIYLKFNFFLDKRIIGCYNNNCKANKCSRTQRLKNFCVLLFFSKRGEIMFLQDKKIANLSVDEYFFLTENLEITNSKVFSKGVKYLVFNRRKNLCDIVEKIMKNELTDFERSIASDCWCEELAIGEIAEKYGTSRSTVYRTLSSAKAKIEYALKYVLLYEENLIPNSTEELLLYVKGEYFEKNKNNSLRVG